MDLETTMFETDWTTYDNSTSCDVNMTTTEPLTTEQTTRKAHDLIPLSTFYDINYLYEMMFNPITS
jgi:hypothetical protein